MLFIKKILFKKLKHSSLITNTLNCESKDIQLNMNLPQEFFQIGNLLSYTCKVCFQLGQP